LAAISFVQKMIRRRQKPATPLLSLRWTFRAKRACVVITDAEPDRLAPLTPGPTIEAVKGEKVRIFVTNKLPERTTVHWYGMLLPNGMDGVGGVTQPHIKPGKTFVYEFELRKSGTFMYHPRTRTRWSRWRWA
jgi:FtsP/CotA-like multicopper oxidase with cupredoxin domain